ncbi:MAG TPA: hypothetical protein VGH50_00490 [Candidatus Binatia bacterium]
MSAITPDYGAYFIFGVELLTSEKSAPSCSTELITGTYYSGGLKWVTGEVGMTEVLTRVVEELARVKEIKAEEMEKRVEENFRLLGLF